MNQTISCIDALWSALRVHGYSRCSDEHRTFFYLNTIPISPFFTPHVMIMPKHVSVMGSIGFSISDPRLNGNLCAPATFDPKNESSASIRVENFPEVSDHSLLSRESDYIAFGENVHNCVKRNVPFNESDLCRLAREDSWISRLIVRPSKGPKLSVEFSIIEGAIDLWCR